MAAKGYKASDRIRIEHPKTGEAYGVTGSAFEKTYEERGFRAVSMENGAPFSLSKGEQEAASRAAAPATMNVGPAGTPPAPAPAKPKAAKARKAPGARARSSGTRSSATGTATSEAGTSPATAGAEG
jgi:hypothetical protein